MRCACFQQVLAEPSTLTVVWAQWIATGARFVKMQCTRQHYTCMRESGTRDLARAPHRARAANRRIEAKQNAPSAPGFRNKNTCAVRSADQTTPDRHHSFAHITSQRKGSAPAQNEAPALLLARRPELLADGPLHVELITIALLLLRRLEQPAAAALLVAAAAAPAARLAGPLLGKVAPARDARLARRLPRLVVRLLALGVGDRLLVLLLGARGLVLELFFFQWVFCWL